jgi:hypothetical protein
LIKNGLPRKTRQTEPRHMLVCPPVFERPVFSANETFGSHSQQHKKVRKGAVISLFGQARRSSLECANAHGALFLLRLDTPTR